MTSHYKKTAFENFKAQIVVESDNVDIAYNEKNRSLAVNRQHSVSLYTVLQQHAYILKEMFIFYKFCNVYFINFPNYQ